ncbi:MAG: hypothetical protein HN380_18655 [Victivallales bacterium]|nr:hypothetical protein [Victivallales bacterium]
MEPWVLLQEVAVPEPLCVTRTIDGVARTFAGDLRAGDLQGDGKLSFVVYRSLDCAHDEGGMKPCFMGAFDVSGQMLWHVGDGGEQPCRPGPVALFDLDGDGVDEILCFFLDATRSAPPDSLANVVMQIRSGRTGEVLRQAAPPELRACAGRGPNWAHQRLLLANLRGLERPRDFVVKLGTVVLAFDENLRVLWRYECPWEKYGNCPAYIPSVGDIDDDGRDEVNGGYYLLDHDGRVLWERAWAHHMDSVAICPWDDGRMRAVGSGGGHVLDAAGNVVLCLGEGLVPHGQEVRIARFDPADPEPQMAMRWNAHDPALLLANTRGEVVARCTLNTSPNNTGMEAIFPDGPNGCAVLYNGGMVWDPLTGENWCLPGLPHPTPIGRMSWYHCIPVVLWHDGAEGIVLYNPWEPIVRVYGPTSHADHPQCFRPSPRQYNARLMD